LVAITAARHTGRIRLTHWDAPEELARHLSKGKSPYDQDPNVFIVLAGESSGQGGKPGGSPHGF